MGNSPLGIVRATTTVVTAAIWWLILYVAGWVFAGAGKVDYVTPLAMANLTAVSYLFVPYFVSEAVLVGMLGALMKKRLALPEVREDPQARPSNPWVYGLMNTLIFGVVAAIIGYMVAKRVPPETLTPSAFAVRYAWGGTVLCTIVAWIVSGRPFLKQVRVAPSNRAFRGGANQYLWTRYILPHGIANLIINGLLAFALAPVGEAVVKAEVVVGDTVITLVILTWLVASGAKGLAHTETEWGIATHDFTADLHMPAAFLPTFFSGIGFCIVLGIAFAWFDVSDLPVAVWAVFRGVFFGAYCGWVAKRCAQASINETFHPEIIVHTRKPSATTA